MHKLIILAKKKNRKHPITPNKYIFIEVQKVPLAWYYLENIYNIGIRHFFPCLLILKTGMYASVPVIAINNGGPLETVKDGVTGIFFFFVFSAFYVICFKIT